ncbi:MAG: hypothetical protein DRI26_09180, partial [Chloroflexi bacterium]
MGQSYTSLSFNILGINVLTVIFAIVAYFIYGNNLGAMLAIVLLSILWNFAMFVSIIPFGGFIIYWFIADYIRSWVFSIANISSTWLTDLMWWLYIIVAIIVTIASTMILLRV